MHGSNLGHHFWGMQMGPGWTHSERFVPFSSHISSKAKFLVLSSIVYSVVLDPTRNQACSGSMDGTVRVWNLSTGQCAHTLTGHTSLVGLLGLSPLTSSLPLRTLPFESGTRPLALSSIPWQRIQALSHVSSTTSSRFSVAAMEP